MPLGTRGTGTDPVAASGARQGRAAIADARLWIGVALLAGSVAVGALVVARPADTVQVWRASQDLGPGAPLVGLEVASVPAELADGTYLAATAPPQGRLRWPLPAGSLVPVAALDRVGTPELRRVTVPVDPLHAPVALLPGSVVDVWWTGGDDSAGSGASRSVGAAPVGAGVGGPGPQLVRTGTVVADVTEDAVGFGGEVAVVLQVPADEVGALVRATRTGQLDLVAADVQGSVSE